LQTWMVHYRMGVSICVLLTYLLSLIVIAMFSADVALAEEEDIVYEQYRIFNAKGELEVNCKKKFHVSYFREDTARDDGDGPCTSSYVTYGDIPRWDAA